MPTPEVGSLRDAQLELSLTVNRGAVKRRYVDWIGQLEVGQAGKPLNDAGENTTAIRRCGDAEAELLGKEVEVNRQGHFVFSREGASASAPRRRTRRG